MNTTPAPERLQRLLGYLNADPNNAALMRDAANAALRANQAETAQSLLERLAALGPLTREDEALQGLTFMQTGAFALAVEVFSKLLQAQPNEPALRFNLAWSLAMENEFDAALRLLDDATTETLPQAAALRVELMHDQGLFEEAGLVSGTLIKRHPNHPGLLAAASVLAMDNEDIEAAGDYARRAGDHPDALTTLGMLALNEDRGAEAALLFAKALEKKNNSPRAWIGSGLSHMLAGDHDAAAEDMTRGAEMFGSHIGSWIGAGWARLVANDLQKARALFDRAMALDHSFAETHGSLAVIDVLEGDLANARRGAETARRLDPASFSAALATALIASSDQRPELARKIIEKALNTPIDQSGRTIAQSLARLGLSH